METRPPRWACRFLEWYCKPDLLEEIQGDAEELYSERLHREGKRSADLKYIWDVLRFFRWSNIKRNEHGFVPGSMGALWGMNFKMAMRNANKNKLVFGIKTIGLSLCLAFSLLLAAYVVNELMYDRFHIDYDRIYRIEFKASFQDRVTDYAVTPLPMGSALAEGIPEIERSFRFMYQGYPIYRIDDNLFNREITLAADSNFLKALTFDFLQGDNRALNEPDKIVLTETSAQKFFGSTNAMGRTVEFGNGMEAVVAAVIKDVPSNSHLKFNALISWNTFDRDDSWGNINAYNYIVLKKGASIDDVIIKAPKVLKEFEEMILREYKATFVLHYDKITDIHFSGSLDEDIAEKGSKSNILILIAVIVLFVITGFINYLNLTLAELTANLRKIGIVRVFGGLSGGHRKILTSEAILTLLIVVPLTAALTYYGLIEASSHFGVIINKNTFTSRPFIVAAFAVILLLLTSTRINGYLLSRADQVIYALQGKFNASHSGLSARKYLVAAQLSFSIIMIALIIIIVDQFRFIQKADKGMNDSNTLVIKLRNNETARIETFGEIIKKVNGVSQVERSTYYPGLVETKDVFQVESEKGMAQHDVPMMLCSYHYLEALDIKILKGRGFREESLEDLNHSFIINETAARQFGWKDAIGKKIKGPMTGRNEVFREGKVIGVTKDFNYASLHTPIEPLIIFLSGETWESRFIYIKLYPLHPAGLISAIEKEYKAQWPEVPFEWEYLDARYRSFYDKDYEIKTIFEAGLVISIFISCLGIFSISALLVSLRTKEMGIRKVVGATAVQLFVLHTRSFLQFLILSILVAWPVIWFLSDKWLQNFAYHVSITIWYFIVPAVIALIITVVTSGYHGLKSGMVNPAEILKHE